LSGTNSGDRSSAADAMSLPNRRARVGHT
jgi:hypothetical protein